jgi:radical SAM superfamily enzyme YgiQ (UPF0313 family)
MKIGLIAIGGVKIQTRKFVELGVTLPQFVNRGQLIAQLPSLALLTIAGSIPRTRPEVELVYLEVDDVGAFVEDIQLDFDLVAISSYTARIFDAYRVADAYRESGIPVVIGGLHATVLPEEAARHADAVVVGEGELTWPELVRDFVRGGRRALKPVYREARPGVLDLDSTLPPRYDLLQRAPPGATPRPDPLESHELHRTGPYNRITVQTTRGCPLDCSFCAASKLYGPRYRRKSVERILREIDCVRAQWSRPFIEFADDNTFVHKGWAKRLLRELSQRDVRYFTETDVSVADDPELLDLLRPSGCRQLLIGFESPRRAGLWGIDAGDWKARRQPQYLDVIERIQDKGVSVCGCFIVGLDADTPAIFDELRAFIERSKLLEVQITVLTPFPGTRLYAQLLAEGRLLYPGAWDRCTLFDVNFRPRGMSVEELEEGLLGLWKDTWNTEAHARRRQHYRTLVAARRTRNGPVAFVQGTQARELRS